MNPTQLILHNTQPGLELTACVLIKLQPKHFVTIYWTFPDLRRTWCGGLSIRCCVLLLCVSSSSSSSSRGSCLAVSRISGSGGLGVWTVVLLRKALLANTPHTHTSLSRHANILQILYTLLKNQYNPLCFSCWKSQSIKTNIHRITAECKCISLSYAQYRVYPICSVFQFPPFLLFFSDKAVFEFAHFLCDKTFKPTNSLFTNEDCEHTCAVCAYPWAGWAAYEPYLRKHQSDSVHCNIATVNTKSL